MRMNKTILLCFVVLALIQHISAECSASSKLIERGDGNSWQENGIPKRIFDLQITNTGTCRIRNSIRIDLKLPPGAHIDASWGLNGGSVVTGFYELVPGQSHSGAGFILSGLGTPTVTVLGFTECICPVGPTEPPTPTPEPTQGPTSTPTNKPTSRPTTAPGDGTFYYVGLKFLILTCNATDIRLSVAKNALEAVGSQYDVIDYPTQGTAPFTFTNTDGSGKYYAFISTTELACWTDAQRIQVEAYEQQFRIKVVILYSFPYPTNGVTMSLGIPITAGTLTFAPAMGPCTSSFQYDAHIPISGVYGYPSYISNSNLATPAVYITIEGTQYVIAAFIKYTDGRSRLEFYVDQADWALFPVLLGTAWFEWASNGIFAGARRIEFNAHMDDIFMNTGTFDPLLGEEGFNITYRITPEDMQETADWQINLNSRLASGSNFTLTFPFNGATVIENGGYTADPLFLKAKELIPHFIWETHTYTHPYLDNMTYSAVKQEFVKNNVTAAALFNDRQATSPYFCPQSCITPSITGLFSANALRAMYDFGIRYVVGDNSRKELVPANLYHGIHTTVAVHGYEGIYILPRHATNIYYDASLPEHIVSQFNYRYSAQVGTLTFPQIVARDVDVATKSLLAYRHDPFMFHQANLRYYSESGTRYSLLSYWVEKVIDSITQYTNLPIISRRHDDLAKVYLERESRDACGFSGQLKVEHGSNVAVGLRAQSTNACTFGISGVRATGSHIVNHETYGNEQTTWIQMTPGADFEITFDEGVAPF